MKATKYNQQQSKRQQITLQLNIVSVRGRSLHMPDLGMRQRQVPVSCLATLLLHRHSSVTNS